MATLLSMRETSMAKNNATNVALQLVVASLQIVLLRCYTCYYGAARVAAALQLALLRRCDVVSCDIATLQVATLRHYSSCGCVVMVLRMAATLRVATKLRHYAWLQCCVATLWRYSSCGCGATHG
ncbi:unnamed protein product [Sphagnum jensenii]|uniref:Secreted protein n=1 Tax=Sphagnum jensenii TaxID=128206 RepID=A0ABP1AGZ2_9BRYO